MLVFVVDQATKLLARQYLNPETGLGQVDVVGSWLRLTYATNTGAAFGIFPDRTLLFTVVALAAVPVLILCQRYLPVTGWPARLSLGLLLGGTVGNLVDRLRYGYVVDFIDAGINSLRWPTFNVADSAFVVGIFILAGYLLFFTETSRTDNAT